MSNPLKNKLQKAKDNLEKGNTDKAQYQLNQVRIAAKGLKEVKSNDWYEKVYQEVTRQLENHPKMQIVEVETPLNSKENQKDRFSDNYTDGTGKGSSRENLKEQGESLRSEAELLQDRVKFLESELKKSQEDLLTLREETETPKEDQEEGREDEAVEEPEKVVGTREKVLVKGTEQSREVEAKVDSGASTTSIDIGLAEKLGFEKEGTTQISSSNGVEERDVAFFKLSVKDVKCNIPVTVTDRSRVSCDLLLGRDALEGFYIEI